MDILDLDLKLLIAYEAMLHTRNVSLAAERVGLSQPAMSTCLGKLRKAMGDALFVRTSRGMEPTPFALELAQPIQDALQLIRQSMSHVKHFDPATSQRTFAMLMSDIGERVFLPSLLQRLSAIAPGVNIRTTQLNGKDMRDAMESGEVDLALGFIPDLKGGFYQQGLFSRSYVCLCRTDHPQIRSSLTLKQFLAASHAVVSAPETGHKIVEKVLAEKGLKRRVALEITNFLAVPLIVGNTDLIVTLPTMLAESYVSAGGLKILEPPITLPSYTIRQYWHERFHEDPANQWLRGLICELFRD